MLKALLKKQLLESFAFIYVDHKSGRKRSGASLFLWAALYLYVALIMLAAFWFFAQLICEPLVEAGIGWLYFALMSLVATVIGVLGGAFGARSLLFSAKDNELLLALPIPSGMLLAVRMSGVYLLGLMYELVVIAPALLLWLLHGRLSALGVIFSLLLPLVLSVLVLLLSCTIGWLAAELSSRAALGGKAKNLVTVVVSLIFIALFYYGYSRVYALLGLFIDNSGAIAASSARMWNPLYHIGRAAEGNALSMLLVVGAVALLFILLWSCFRRGYLRLVTSNRGGRVKSAARAREGRRSVRVGGVGRALLAREFNRFLSSSNYMLNCGLGCILMPIAAVLLLVKQEELMTVLLAFIEPTDARLPLLAAAAVCVTASMNDMTAPSISLEGRTLWLLQSLPVSGWQIFRAKLEMQLLLTLIPAALLIGCIEAVLRFELLYVVLIFAVAALFSLFMAELGLVLNLKMPNLSWTNEIAPIKQSFAVTLVLFGGWGVLVLLVGLYFATAAFMSPAVYLLTVCALLLVGSVLLCRWLKTCGARLFAEL